MISYAKTDVGKKRSMNQDFYYCSEESVGSFQNLFIVADGMGGHKAGDHASRLCVDQAVAAVRESRKTTPVTIFQEAVERANQKIYDSSREHEEFQGMGTTMVACTFQDNKMIVSNVGDSRLYLIRDGISKITDDHSLVEELVRKGNLTESEARIHPQKNIITRALGTEKDVSADFFEVDMQEGDYILLCSDGLSNMVDEEDMEYTVKNSSSLEEAGESLIRQANKNGGEDNITVILIQYR